MEALETTYLLAAGHVVLVLAAFALTARPLITTYHWILLTWLIAFGVRPALAASVGGYTNYDSGIGWQAYNYGLLYQLVFLFCLSAAYVVMYYTRPVCPRPLEGVVRPKAFYVLLALGLSAIFGLHVLSDGAWLPGARTGTINTVVPGGKYIFPIGVMSFSLLIPFAAICYIKNRFIKRWMLITAAVVAFTGLSLLFMRGMVITGVLLILWAMEKDGKLKAKHIVVGILAVFLIGQMLRPLGKYVAVRYLLGEDDADFVVATAAAVEKALSPLEKMCAVFLFSANLDIADSWPVVIHYVDANGFLDGRSFLAIPARFASTKFRIESGYLTGSDIVNSFFYGGNYEETSFGLQVTLANELFLNFGTVGLLFGLLPGLATWAADKWMRRTRLVSPSSLSVAYICFRGFTNELALTVQWAFGVLALALVVEVLARLDHRKPVGSWRTVPKSENASA